MTNTLSTATPSMSTTRTVRPRLMDTLENASSASASATARYRRRVIHSRLAQSYAPKEPAQPGLLSPEHYHFDAAYHGPSGHGDSQDFLVARGGEVGELEEGAEAAPRVRGVQVPDGVGVAGAAVEGSDSGAHKDASGEAAGPGGDGGVGRVVEDIFGEGAGQGVLGSAQGRVAEVDLVAGAGL